MLRISILEESWISIKSNKLRSFLTILGVLIGISTVIMMVEIGQTVMNTINSELKAFGGNKLIIVPGSSGRGGIRSGRGQPTISYKDALAIREVKDVELVSPVVGYSGRLVYGGENWATNIVGTDPTYLQTEDWEIEKGSFFTQEDFDNSVNSIVIGKTVADKLFENVDPIGKSLRISNIPFTVVGVLKSKGASAGGHDTDDTSIAPLFVIKRKITNNRFPDKIDIIILKVNKEQNLKFVQRRIKVLLRERHKLSDFAEDDFEIIDLTEIVNRQKRVGLVLSLLLVFIGSISLLVGSIGIVNMMLVSVAERTREIGIRKALGAKESDILYQFMLEAILISVIGSIIGTVLGIGMSKIGGYVFNKHVETNVFIIFVSIFVSIVIGVISGIVPALKAARLNPIDALRS